MAYALRVKARYRNDKTGRELRLPAIITEGGLLISHLRFLASKTSNGQSWRDRSTFAVMLLIKYINANEGSFEQTTELLRSFRDALDLGTIDSSDLSDPSGLYWSPRSPDDVNSIIQYITTYTDWLAKQSDYETKRANPYRLATSVEQRLNWCAYYHRQDNVFLNHLESTEDIKEKNRYVREIARRGNSRIYDEEVKKFPADKIIPLLESGFVRATQANDANPDKTIDWKGRAITLLLHYGGLRKSEALHLYLNDIKPDKNRHEAVVRVYHPSTGASPDKNYRSRREYLAKRYLLKPRTDYLKSERLHLGWKAPALTSTEGYFTVQFYPPNKATEFLHAYQNYLKYQRVEPSIQDHPYAFTNTIGQPETLKNFQRLHKAAVNRIGLEHLKYLGTTEHGHRHAYGYRLAEMGFSQLDIQKAMHHRSPDSCLVYLQSTNKELREKMERVNNYGA
ncbi:gamma-mobile-trio recombinase GmtY [Pseudomonas atacamensis]|uniref:gamma-mobile-trio recombinase GmtY n=1 Tax=Pseudomonas atacamensis TaxID=2565368 RepID=UPI001EED57B9|nr:gamma-mobile-trio recombinase GmtY [Pseudomonas atacamensis]